MELGRSVTLISQSLYLFEADQTKSDKSCTSGLFSTWFSSCHFFSSPPFCFSCFSFHFPLHKYSTLTQNQLLEPNKEMLKASGRLSHYARGPPRSSRTHSFSRMHLLTYGFVYNKCEQTYTHDRFVTPWWVSVQLCTQGSFHECNCRLSGWHRLPAAHRCNVCVE